MTRNLVQIHNLRTLFPSYKNLLFDDDASGAFRHVKLNLQVEEAHVCSVGQTLYMLIGLVFVDKVIPYDWEAFM